MKFSVTIPAYKKKYLKECIDSILSQSYSDFELIIVNDASPEDLDSVISLYSDIRIRYYKNEQNCGAVNVVDNWNKCLNYAKGDYIICMGDDDRLLPNCLEEYSKLIERYPRLGVYHAWTEIIDEESQVYDIQDARPSWESALSLLWNRWSYRTKQYIGDFLFETDLLKRNGGFKKFPLAWSSDDISAVMAATQTGCANTQTLCFQYRVNRYNISSSGNAELKIKAVEEKKEWVKDFLEKLDINSLTESDVIYYHLLETKLDGIIKKRLIYYITTDIAKNPIRIIRWIMKSKELNIGKVSMIKEVLKAGMSHL